MLHGLLVHWIKFLKRWLCQLFWSVFKTWFLTVVCITKSSVSASFFCACGLKIGVHIFFVKKKNNRSAYYNNYMDVCYARENTAILFDFQSKHYFNVSLPRPYPLQFLKRLSCLLQLLILFLAGCSQSFNFHLEFIYLWSCQTNLTLRIHKHLS